MPIYEYRCSSCGHSQDVLQKVSDVPLTVCPACQSATFAKALTAAGFQLKGSGWYATDFRGGNTPAAASGDAAPAAESAGGQACAGACAAAGVGTPASTPAAQPTASAS